MTILGYLAFSAAVLISYGLGCWDEARRRRAFPAPPTDMHDEIEEEPEPTPRTRALS